MLFIQNLFFIYLNPFFKRVLNKNEDWNENDLPKLKVIFSDKNLKRIEKSLSYTEEKQFFISLFKSSKAYIILIIILTLTRVILNILPFMAIYFFVDQITQQKNIYLLILSAFLLPLVVALNGIITSHYFHQTFQLKFLIKYLLSRKIFKEIPKIKKEKYSESQLINNSSHDIEEISSMSPAIPEFIHDTLVIFGSILLLVYYIGISAIFSILIIFIIIPFIKYIIKIISQNDEYIQRECDSRIQTLNSIFMQMRNIKSYLLESNVRKKVTSIRKNEIYYYKKNAKKIALTSLLFASTQSAICITTFGSYLFLGNELTTPLVFTCLGIFKVLESSIIDSLEYIKIYSSGKASLKRLFFLFKISENHESYNKLNTSERDQSIQLQSVKISQPKFSVDLSIKKGESVAIVGRIGSGKSLLLEIISGLKKIDEGSLQLSSHPLFLAQTPWIINSSIKENISLDNKNMNIDQYIYAANLENDIKNMKKGINSEIGENGIKLSGGQKQRIALARAASANADILLLDDPFSALDKTTEDIIAERLLFGLWKNKSRIVTTHRLKYLPMFDRIILLEDGKIKAQGHFSQLIKNSIPFQKFYQYSNQDISLEKNYKPNENLEINDNSNENILNINIENNQLKKPFSTYIDYLKLIKTSSKSIGLRTYALLFILVLFSAFFPKIQDIWLSFWASGGIKFFNLEFINSFSNNKNIYIFSIIGLLSAISVSLLTLIWGIRGIQTSELLHSRSLNHLLEAPLSFIDNLTSGKFISRFSHDISILDSKLPHEFQKFTLVIFEIIFFLISICFIKPAAIFILIPIIILQKKILLKYVYTIRELNRRIAIPRAARINTIRECYQGQQILSPLNKQKWYYKKYINILKNEIRMEVTEEDVDLWHCLMCFLNNSLLVLLICFGGIYLVRNALIDPSLIALITTWVVIDVLNIVFNTSHTFAAVEQGLISLERINDFNSKEIFPKKSKIEQPKNFKSENHIVFKNVYLKYEKEGNYILNNFSISFNFGEIIGIVGKTGSGKSSIIQLLLKFYEVSHGHIIFNGKNFDHYSTQEIREKISIVLQNPLFFPGTLRHNLDPHNLWNDHKIISLLEELEILNEVKKLPNGIYSDVLLDNFLLSHGQKQILSFARALLKPSQVLLLDEVTAHIDRKSELIIMRKLGELKGMKTIIMIAHRTELLVCADKIISL